MIKRVRKNFTRINALFIFGVLLILTSYIPYVNLIITNEWYWTAFLLFGLIIFKVSTKKALLLGIVLFTVSVPWVFAGSRVGSEIFGVLTFICMLYAIIKEVWKFRKS